MEDETLQKEDTILSLIDHMNGIIQQLMTSSENLHLDTLRSTLQKLAIPTRHSSFSAWPVFRASIQDIMLQHRSLRTDWNFTYEQSKQLESYLWGTQFLLECLNLAYVSDRERIEARLLLPPGVGS